jgi:hypothetical protein
MVSLMLMLYRSLLNSEYILINVLKVLASVISIYNLHLTFYKCLHRDILRYLPMECFVHLVYDGTQTVDDYEKSKSPESRLNLF